MKKKKKEIGRENRATERQVWSNYQKEKKKRKKTVRLYANEM